MDQLENIFKLDEANIGSFGSLEKGVAYIIVLTLALPVLLIPALYHVLGNNIYKTTLAVSFFLIGIALVIYLKFSWIIFLTNRLQQYIHA